MLGEVEAGEDYLGEGGGGWAWGGGEGGGGRTCATSGLALGSGREASEFMEPEMSSTKMQCVGLREGRSAAAMVTHKSFPFAQQLMVTSWQGGRSAEKSMAAAAAAAVASIVCWLRVVVVVGEGASV